MNFNTLAIKQKQKQTNQNKHMKIEFQNSIAGLSF